MAGEYHHPDAQGYLEEGYVNPLEASQDVSTHQTVQSTVPRNMNYATTKNQMLGSEGRLTHMNTPAAAGTHPMANVIYGFRPESGWGGILFQVFLQGPFLSTWQKQKELEFWISFQGKEVPAALHEMDSNVSIPEVGMKRYVLQCFVPHRMEYERCSVTLAVLGVGGKSLAGGLFIGKFQYRPCGIFFFSSTNWR